jgi:anti-anti-sigma factor
VTQAHEFTVEKLDHSDSGAVVYRFSGVMGESQHCYSFLERFLEELPAAPARIVFNLGGLENMFSSGIGIMANCYTKATEANKTLVLAAVPKVIHRTLTITGIQPMLKQYETEEEAIAAG